MPSLPEAGPIRLIAILGTLAMLAWLVCAVISARRKRRDEAWWSLLVLGCSVLTMIAGRLDGTVHGVVQLLTVGIAARNARAFLGLPRWLTIVGILAWMTSAVIAMRHFG
ncbi:MAG: hypothetical protein ACPGU1_13735 [Myxococcota bacterium]